MQHDSILSILLKEQDLKRDLVLSSEKIDFSESGEDLFLELDGYQLMVSVNENMERQISEKLNIPYGYYTYLKDQIPSLLAKNINDLLRLNKKNYLIRMYNGEPILGRALLSDRFNLIDDIDVFNSCVDGIKNAKVDVDTDLVLKSSEKMFLFFLNKEKGSLINGISVQSGFILTNSEVGAGRFEIAPRMLVNGYPITFTEKAFTKYHIGQVLQEGEIINSEKIRTENMQRILQITEQAIEQFFDENFIRKTFDKFLKSHEEEFKFKFDVAENIIKHLGLKKDIKDSFIREYLVANNYTHIGLFFAVSKSLELLSGEEKLKKELELTKILPILKKFDKPSA